MTLSFLQPGMRVHCAGRICLVKLVNDCHATLVPVEKRKVTVVPLMGKPVTFERSEKSFNISPNSELEVVG